MLARVVELADAGKFKVFVDGTYPMADAAQGLGEEPRRATRAANSSSRCRKARR